MSQYHVRHTAEFKARVALAALSGQREIAEISREYGVAAEQVASWRDMVIENAPRFFEREGIRTFSHEIEVIDLFHRLSKLRGDGRHLSGPVEETSKQ